MNWWNRSFSYLFSITFLLVVVTGPSVNMPSLSSFFMPHGEAACDMSALDHIALWQGTLTSTAIKAMVAIGFGTAVFLILEWAYSATVFRAFRRYSPPNPTLLQELFARGLLHSKAY